MSDTGASFARGQSKQDYGTPRDFLAMRERLWPAIGCDLAATSANSIGRSHLGPGSKWSEDSLSFDWGKLYAIEQGVLWLNPPFGNIRPWAERCALFAREGCRIQMLVPASVGSNWFWDYVEPFAHVYMLTPRLTFNIGFDADGNELFDVNPKTGKADPYPKDCMLCYYNKGERGFTRLNWRTA